jgi:hypothetical protein
LYDYDPCHYFCWWLDAYINKIDINKLEERRMNDLRQYLSSQEMNTPGDNLIPFIKVWGDLAMIIGNPIANISIIRNIYYFLESAEFKFIQKSKKKPSGFFIGDENSEENLKLLSQLYLAGCSSQKMIKEKKFVFPVVDRDLVDIFYPMMMTHVFKDALIDEENSFKLHYFVKMNPICEKVSFFFFKFSVNLTFYFKFIGKKKRRKIVKTSSNNWIK